MNLDRVEEFAVQHLDSNDVRITRRNKFLHQRGGIQTEDEAVLLSGQSQSLRSVEAPHAGSAAADIRLDDQRPAKPLSRRQSLRRSMNYPGFRIRQPKLLKQQELRRLRELGAKSLEAVDDAHSAAFQVLQVPQRVEDGVAVIAVPRRRAHLVQDE